MAIQQIEIYEKKKIKEVVCSEAIASVTPTTGKGCLARIDIVETYELNGEKLKLNAERSGVSIWKWFFGEFQPKAIKKAIENHLWGKASPRVSISEKRETGGTINSKAKVKVVTDNGKEYLLEIHVTESYGSENIFDDKEDYGHIIHHEWISNKPDEKDDNQPSAIIEAVQKYLLREILAGYYCPLSQ